MFLAGIEMTKLLFAISYYEGFDPPSEKNNYLGSVAWRNKNPGNLRSSVFEAGKRDGFAYFYNDIVGYFALQYDIMQKAKGNTITKLNGESTIVDLIEVYAPRSDRNDTDSYIKFVLDFTKFDRNYKLKNLLK